MEQSFFGKKNYAGIAVGAVMLAVGYYCLSLPPVDSVWSMTVAPILLTVAYCVVLPVAILFKNKGD